VARYWPRGLGCQPLDQQPSAACQHFPVQASLLPHVTAGALDRSFGRSSHVADSEILNPNQVEPLGQVGGDLLAPVSARVGLPGLELGNGQSCLATARGTGLAPSELARQQDQATPPRPTE